VNKLDDNRLIIIQENGIETKKYKFVTMFKTTIKFKDTTKLKAVNKTLTFRIRENVYGDQFNYFEEGGASLNFWSIDEIKVYLSSTFGNYKPTDWNPADVSKG
jgi:hypothetical protein